MRKLWTACGYTPEDEINASNKDAIIPYSVENFGTMVEKFCGEDACTNFEDESANGPEPFFHRGYEGDDDNKKMLSEFD